MKTFSIQTLGCKVNQYESEQIAAMLRARGLTEVPQGGDVRVINTCSVTTSAAKKSGQTVRRATRLPVMGQDESDVTLELGDVSSASKVIVTGCWATSDPQKARSLPGVTSVITHHDNVAQKLEEALTPPRGGVASATPITPKITERSLPLLSERTENQRAYLKIQDGCDAHCTYCIIPQLRPTLSSKSIDDCLKEARQLVAAGHVELVLTGIFLGAYGQPTALRRRQSSDLGKPLADLIAALSEQVPGLLRLRLSSLEPGDLDEHLIKSLRQSRIVVPHFHLPLQSGSEHLLRRMNRQYTRSQFLDMIDRVHAAFDRPALTTDIIVGFPGETDAEFESTLDVVDRAKFIHVHAFSYSTRPRTAAARWTKDFVNGPIVQERIDTLTARAAQHSQTYRQQFVGQTAQLLVERGELAPGIRHGRTERYFDVYFESAAAQPGDLLTVRIDHVSATRTAGTVVKEPL